MAIRTDTMRDPRRSSRGTLRVADRVREIYFLQADTLRLIKIGVTNDTSKRLSSMQTMSPDKLTLLGLMICPSYGALEAWLHNRFREHRAHGEWFHPALELMAFIEQNALDEDTAVATRSHEIHARGAPGRGLPWVIPVYPLEISSSPHP